MAASSPTTVDLGRPGTSPAHEQAPSPATGLVPADRVSVVTVELPDVRGARLNQALRWAAEDALAGDAEQQHVVPVERNAEGRMICAVAARNDMQTWCTSAPGLSRLVPDAAALPWREGELVLAASGDAVLARWGCHAFDRLDAELLDALLPDLVDQAGPHAVIWYGPNEPACVSELQPQRRELPGSLDALLADGAKTTPMNLLHGDFAPAGRNARPKLLWTLALVAAAALLLIADSAVEVAQLERRADTLQTEIERRSAEVFPDLQLLPGRERVLLERAVAGRTGRSDGLVQMLRRVAPVFSALDALTVESVAGAEQRLDVSLQAPGLPDLEALQRQVEVQGLDARVEDVAVDAGSVRARLVIERRPDASEAGP